ncbi:MAG: tetratricopeptide repeat protein [Planctomycetes bacterium]|nr:tetratricopeptide repeat protein [Planctomycetota bacterium]
MNATPETVASQPPRPERFFPWLVGLLVVALGLHAWILAEAWEKNPFVTSLQADASTYWTWAERIAAGQWIGTEPFHVPPLYAYLLALLQKAGGGLLAAYRLQLVLHLVSIAFVALIGRRLAGASVGLVAAVLFASFQDGAFFVQRLSPPSLQVALIAWTWWEWLGSAERPSFARALRSGLALGFAVLANPVMLPVAALLLAWLAWRARKNAVSWSCVVATALVTGATIAPAPIHNWLAAHELIPISTQGGLAFAIGNAPGATGVYHELEGVSVLRERQDHDALLLARAKTGDPNLGWNGADRYFYGRGFDFWFGAPGDALVLLAQKVHWFFSGRHYSDSYMPTLEIESGFASRLRFAWLRPAWVVLLAFVGAWFVRRAWCPSLPGWIVLTVPLVAVVVYHYSSRYRVPALPAVAVFAAWGLVEIVRGRDRARRVVLGGSLALGLCSGWIDADLEFDTEDQYRSAYEHLLGATYLSRGEPMSAAPHLQRAYELGQADSQALLAEVLRGMGKLQDARSLAEDALKRNGEDGYALRVLGFTLADQGDFAGAATHFQRALVREPTDAESLRGLGSCELSLGRPAEALAHYDRALELSPGREDVAFFRGIALEALGRDAEAEAAWSPLALHAVAGSFPGAPAKSRLIELWIRTGRYGFAIQRLRANLAADPSDGDSALALARLLAASPNTAERDGAYALQLAQGLRSVAPNDPQVLEIWALALAEGGHFDEAVQAATTSAATARAQGATDFAAEMDRRTELFRAGQPFRFPVVR